MTFWYSFLQGYCAVLKGLGRLSSISGGYGEGETPLPFPNRAVKPLSADGTWPARARESRSPPVSSAQRAVQSGGPFVVLAPLCEMVKGHLRRIGAQGVGSVWCWRRRWRAASNCGPGVVAGDARGAEASSRCWAPTGDKRSDWGARSRVRCEHGGRRASAAIKGG